MIDSEWHYRVFFSVDIENSTSFKYSKVFKSCDESSNVKNSEWLWGAAFRDFFDSFIDIFFTKNEKIVAEQKINGIEFQNLEIWKFMGDEIIFVVELTDVRAVLWHVYAFKNAIKDYNENNIDGKANLKCKGTVWGAGFPINNFPFDEGNDCSENVVLAEKNKLLKKEYVGVNIDAGFRLSKFSTPRNLVISIEIAFFLSKSWNVQKDSDSLRNFQFPKIKYRGKEILKGIFFNNPYPVFFIDLLYQVPPHEDKWLCSEIVCEPNEIDAFCTHFFEKTTFFSTPFIANDKSEACSTVPPEMEKRRNVLIDGMKSLKYDAGENGTNEVDSSELEGKLANIENS